MLCNCIYLIAASLRVLEASGPSLKKMFSSNLEQFWLFTTFSLVHIHYLFTFYFLGHSFIRQLYREIIFAFKSLLNFSTLFLLEVIIFFSFLSLPLVAMGMNEPLCSIWWVVFWFCDLEKKGKRFHKIPFMSLLRIRQRRKGTRNRTPVDCSPNGFCSCLSSL